MLHIRALAVGAAQGAQPIYSEKELSEAAQSAFGECVGWDHRNHDDVSLFFVVFFLTLINLNKVHCYSE